jgi:hypothetical protein
MNALSEDALHDFCGRHGIHAPLLQEPVGAGRNSRVTRLSNAAGCWILKDYGPPDARGHDRLGTEFAFLQYLEACDIQGVARPIGADRRLFCALYSLLPGERPARITTDAITQAAEFIAAVNRHGATPQALALTGATDGCRRWQDHLALVEDRLTRLVTVTPQSRIEERVRELVADTWVPRWRAMAAQLADSAVVRQPITPILSPSDFGFHNTLLHQGHLRFVDFEYAGWDDPVKLICDFLCQPDLPITREQGRQFTAQLSRAMPQIGDVAERVALLLPVHRLKWCCILLNEFGADSRRRRLHAGLAEAGLLELQFDKANRYFKAHFGGRADSISSSAYPHRILH